jgi:hypothetical protein
MESIKVTLYDIFGYLLPGILLLVALAIAFWALFYPTEPLRQFELANHLLVAVLTVGYIAGHVLQGVANLIYAGRDTVAAELPASVVAAARAKLRRLGMDTAGSGKDLYEIAHEFVTQRGVRENQELMEYRTGFYRGMSLAFVGLSGALVFRWISSDTFVGVSPNSVRVTWGMFLFVILFSAVTAFFFHRRYGRFVRYRALAGIAGFVALKEEE